MKKLFSKLFHKKKKEAHPFCSAIVAAAGSSRRMEGENKLLLLPALQAGRQHRGQPRLTAPDNLHRLGNPVNPAQIRAGGRGAYEPPPDWTRL